MNERFKQLRLQVGLNQTDMANKLNLSQAHISALEKGTKIFTNRLVDDICRKFNASEEWLRTGNGEMFVANIKDKILSKILVDATLQGDDLIKDIMINASKLTKNQKKAFAQFLSSLIEDEEDKI
ncbi:helix-turn-helix domain-containing protein [Metasolibacillus sp.]|uniref:helix-turn-helix transcriptional regulator n=1 Tax=Metasolibacillus sp. TaxID=2703680 RepID=UPI0025DA41D2|nr:helix-turn-helix domain-containing protein [Metasolibacillus sp.]MCT6922773.1 helix-turn-helix domain-containing protein [Metasolibacillus sp.]MCT6938888.1 helix-turn-helix domain-containing protein [Metasolibacillus sp.]